MPISQGGKGLRTKHSVWVGPSFVFIREVTWEPRPRQAIDPAIRPRQGDLAKMAASEAAPVPQRSWALSLGRLLPPGRGDCSSLVFLTRGRGGGTWWPAKTLRSRGRGEWEGRRPASHGSFPQNHPAHKRLSSRQNPLPEKPHPGCSCEEAEAHRRVLPGKAVSGGGGRRGRSICQRVCASVKEGRLSQTSCCGLAGAA